jgi:hypothetical protein
LRLRRAHQRAALLPVYRVPLEKLLARRHRLGLGIEQLANGGSDCSRELGLLRVGAELKSPPKKGRYWC